MKNTILIHGAPYEAEFHNPEKPSPSNTNWFPWLQKQLALKNEISQALEFPRPYDPVYHDWVSVIKDFKIDNETVLIGHSCGGGFLLRYLSENKDLLPKKVVLVAPWLDPTKELTTDFFNFEINRILTTRTDLHIFVSSDDESDLLQSFEIVKEMLPDAVYHEYADKGHFCDKEFPEILELL